MTSSPTGHDRTEPPTISQQSSSQPPPPGTPPSGSSQPPPGTQPPYRQLRRPTTDRMIAGVASGLGRYFNVDPTLVRVVFAAVVVLTGGVALLAYPVMWFLMPEEPANAPAWPHPAPGGPPWRAPGA